MNRLQIRTFLQALGIKVSKTPRAGWVVARCPFAEWRHEKGTDNSPSFGIKIETAKESAAHCLACHYHSDLSSMVVELRQRRGKDWGTADYKLAMSLLSEVADAAPLTLGLEPDEDKRPGIGPEFPAWWLEKFPRVTGNPFASDARVYLDNRKGGPIAAKIIDRLDLRWDADRERVCVPVHDWDGVLRNFQGRAIGTQEPKYLFYPFQGHYSPDLWLGEAWVDLDKPVVVVEGYLDLARVLQVYRNVIAVLGSPSESKFKRMANLREVIDLVDQDKAGRLLMKNMRRALPKCTFTEADWSDLPPKLDPGACTVSQIAALLEPYVPLDEIIV